MHHRTPIIMNRVVMKSSRSPSAFNLKNIDLTIFKTPKTECRQTPDNIPLTERCSSLLRLCTASRYIDAVTASKLDEEEQRALLVEFNEEAYNMILDDTEHLVNVHSDDVQQIKREWTEHFGFAKCAVSQCVKTSRHYGRGRREMNNEVNGDDEVAKDPLYEFYRSLYDRVHHFVWHLYDIGLRVDINSLGLNGGGSDEKEAGTEGVTVDKAFAAERDCVRSRREECQLATDRFEEAHGKFSIETVSHNMNEVTLLDVLIERLEKMQSVQPKTVQRVKVYLKEESCDSDYIEMDIEDIADSTVCGLLKNEEAAQMISDFIRSIKLLRTAFSTGFTFEYWYNSGKYRVKAKFQTLKEEILQSGFLTAAQWEKLVELKAKKYWKTARAQKMKVRGRTSTGQLNKGSPVTMEHLKAVILYCDFSKLCTAFSSTFRRLNVFEGIESVIARHSEFGNFGRLLVEAVLDFGANGRGPDGERGPFFCGVNRLLNIGTYAIRLEGPCSTTTKRAIALNFAKSDGLIMSLKNDSGNGQFQSVLNCAWISNFFEESERLWIAGTCRLRIVSITIVKTARNYQKVLRALYLFDWMILERGGLDSLRISEEPGDSEVISNILGLSLNSVGVIAVDPYLKKECELFLQKKETVTLNMDKIFENKSRIRNMSKLLLHNIVDNGTSEPKEKDNVMRPEWISIFPAITSVVFNDEVWSGSPIKYEFRLDAILETVKQISPNITVTVKDLGKWCEKALTDDIREAYNASGWSIEYEKEKRSLIIKSLE